MGLGNSRFRTAWNWKCNRNSCGSNYSVAVSTDGRLFHWGCNYLYENSNVLYPTQIETSEKFRFVSCAAKHFVAISGFS
jgi:alpha-tubulin suppressor-like RCC1 family protein